MNRFDEWIAEVERATLERVRKSNPLSDGWLSAKITLFPNIRKYTFVQVGPKPRFAVAMDGTIYGIKSNDVNKKECYGNVNTFEEFEWANYYPVKKALYEWQYQTKKATTKKTPTHRKRKSKTSKLTMARQSKAGTWIDSEAISTPPRTNRLDNHSVGTKRTTNSRNRSTTSKNEDQGT
jgi:hypothetical protein